MADSRRNETPEAQVVVGSGSTSKSGAETVNSPKSASEPEIINTPETEQDGLTSGQTGLDDPETHQSPENHILPDKQNTQPETGPENSQNSPKSPKKLPSQPNNNEPNQDAYTEVHPIELAAHTLLSTPLDSLNENFELLNQSQLILLTRLKIIEDRLQSFKKVVEGSTVEKNLAGDLARVKELRKRLNSVVKTLGKVDQRVEKISEKLK